ncbi:hypothetical protein BS47DRAFT_1339106 [Hydnum rufescens UP504]|uniref:Uncharacterized protein n=1 Tax=Hydnum rufescens UP504 TaxID=1448309 RepID=A0A9P6E0I4_9AGAM|nr:hypothetical protein BS47DRAFT_1339106 [Hydnum rufescens UP504]
MNISRTPPFSNTRVNVPPPRRVSQMGLRFLKSHSITRNGMNALSVSPPTSASAPLNTISSSPHRQCVLGADIGVQSLGFPLCQLAARSETLA